MLEQAAHQALACLDLTSLNDGDTAADIEALCHRAQTAHGPVAAVCVWPHFVTQARALLPRTVRVAAVANFPDGSLDLQRVLAEVSAIAQAGADEVDVVLPYRALKAGQSSEVAEFLAEVRFATRPLTLKVIIESGELKDPELIAEATRLALVAGADFVKTSTGKSAVSATLEAARVMLREIQSSGLANAGFKASGGIRTVADAAEYLRLVQATIGTVSPQRFRFGASGLLNDIEAVLAGKSAAASPSSY
ncbi:MAG: deoxyribose-phosphate aldolase [Paucibacter sp.]|nr:deoxyribose-phosphate aldolase [Roseateles sp.]